MNTATIVELITALVDQRRNTEQALDTAHDQNRHLREQLTEALKQLADANDRNTAELADDNETVEALRARLLTVEDQRDAAIRDGDNLRAEVARLEQQLSAAKTDYDEIDVARRSLAVKVAELTAEIERLRPPI